MNFRLPESLMRLGEADEVFHPLCTNWVSSWITRRLCFWRINQKKRWHGMSFPVLRGVILICVEMEVVV